MGSIPGSGRSPGGGHTNPLQRSCLENPIDRGVWQARVHRAAESWTRLKHDLACTHMPDAPERNEYFQRQQDKGEVSLDFQGVEVHTLLYQKKYTTYFLAVPCHLRKTTVPAKIFSSRRHRNYRITWKKQNELEAFQNTQFGPVSPLSLFGGRCRFVSKWDYWISCQSSRMEAWSQIWFALIKKKKQTDISHIYKFTVANLPWLQKSEKYIQPSLTKLWVEIIFFLFYYIHFSILQSKMLFCN